MNFRERRTLPIEPIFASKHRRRWGSGRFSPGSQDPFGQMPRHGRLFAKLAGQGVTLRKWLAHQHAAEASGGTPGLAIPEAGGSKGSCSCQVGPLSWLLIPSDRFQECRSCAAKVWDLPGNEMCSTSQKAYHILVSLIQIYGGFEQLG